MYFEKETNLRVKVGEYDPMKDEMVRTKSFRKRYVTEGMGKEHTDWKNENPVLISSPTGSGKNYYIEEVLVPFSMETGKDILIVSNRIAVNRQLKRRIAKKSKKEKILDRLTPEGLDSLQVIGNVRFLSYQQYGEMLDKKSFFELESMFKGIGIVVFDEAHFFVSDSLFNSRTEYILDYCIRLFCNAIRIYMSATPDEVFPEIVIREKQFCSNKYTVNCMASYQYAALTRREILYYNFKCNYKYINSMKYFEYKDEIINAIKSDRTPNKWIVFVTSKRMGKEVCNELGDAAVFVDADSKKSTERDGDIYMELVEKEKFSAKVLIATSVIDNGINIKDESVKNIVIFTYDKTEFIQMLGRKRIEEGENITLYICSRDSKSIGGTLHQVNQKIAAICTYKKDKNLFMKEYYESSADKFDIVRGIFYFNRQGSLCLNSIAERKLFTTKKFLEHIQNKLDNGIKEAFILEQLSWLGLQKTYDERNWLNYNSTLDNKTEFINFLEQNVDVTLLEDEAKNFYIKFKMLYTKAYGKRKNDRNDRVYKAPICRDIFEEQSLHYDIKIVNKCVTLIRT